MFVAIEIEESMKRSLSRLIDGLVDFDRQVRWVKREQIHLTLKFLGEVADETAPAVSEACRSVAMRCAPFVLTLDGCGCFPPRGKVRVIWGGSSRAPDGLLRCAGGCEADFESLGFARETRPFAAHMTVGRARDDRSGGRLRAAVEAHEMKQASQTVDSMTLFQSVLHPQGAQHQALGRFPFGEREAPAGVN